MSILTHKSGQVNTNLYHPPSKVHPALQKSKGVTPAKRERARAKVRALDTSAISVQQASEVARVEFTPGGVIAKRTLHCSPGKPAIRGEVKGLSRKSAKRLRERMCRIDWGKLVPADGKSERAFLLSITYPSQYPTSWREHKANLKAFIVRLRRRFDVQGLLWRLEHQRRSAPHYHVILVLGQSVDAGKLQRWCLRAWFEVCGTGDPWHLIHGADTRQLYGKPGKLMRYLSKVMRYISKSEDGGPAAGTGRCWGVWGELPEGETLVVSLTRERWVEFTRRLRRWGKGSRYVEGITASWRGFCVFGADDRTKQLLRGLWQWEPGGSHV